MVVATLGAAVAFTVVVVFTVVGFNVVVVEEHVPSVLKQYCPNLIRIFLS